MASEIPQEFYPQVKDLINPTEAEIEQTVNILVDAFEDDPFSLILLGGNLSLAPKELRANVKAALMGGQVHVITQGPQANDIVGVAVWYPPGHSAFRTEEERAQGWNDFLEIIPEWLRKWWIDYFIPTVSKLSTNALGEGFLLDAWHLHLFGVLKSHQRKGYGKALLQLAENRARQDGKPLVLETTTDLDVQIYQRLGYRVCGETFISSPIENARMRLMIKETSAP